MKSTVLLKGYQIFQNAGNSLDKFNTIVLLYMVVEFYRNVVLECDVTVIRQSQRA